MYCAECGKEIPDDSEFCGFCGATAAAAAAAEQAPPVAAAPQSPPPPPPVTGNVAPPPPPPGGGTPPMGTGVPQAPYGPMPPKKSPLPWILGILGALVVIGVIVVLLLGFAVGPKWFAGDDNGDGGGGGKAAGNPEQTVENFYNAFEKQDIDMFIATMEPDFVEEMEDALGDEYADQLEENLFSGMPEDIDFEIEEMESEVTGDTAEVTIIAGTMSYTEDGEEITEDIEDSDMADFTFELVEVDGKWYLSEDTLVEMGFDYSDLESDGDGDYDSDGDYDPGDLVDLPVDSEDEVVTLLLEETEIWDWYMETDYPDYDISEESDVYEVYLFELDEDDNEIPFAYYAVDKETGEVYEITR